MSSCSRKTSPLLRSFSYTFPLLHRFKRDVANVHWKISLWVLRFVSFRFDRPTIFRFVQADSIVVHSQSGNINCSGSLHGTIDLSTERDGVKRCSTLVFLSTCLFHIFQSIRASKLQGGFVRLKVENSDARVRSLYSEHFLIQGQRGTFQLGNLHGHGIGKNGLGSIDR